MTEPVVRLGEERDFAPIVDIYNHYIRETTITFDIEPFTVETRGPWFEKFAATGPYRLLVAEDGGEVIGYAATLQYRPKAAYNTSVETSIYLHPERRGAGLGTTLYAALFEAVRDEDLYLALAGITLPNAASVAIHERFGFKPVGTYHEVGRKFGAYWDVLWMEKPINRS